MATFKKEKSKAKKQAEKKVENQKINIFDYRYKEGEGLVLPEQSLFKLIFLLEQVAMKNTDVKFELMDSLDSTIKTKKTVTNGLGLDAMVTKEDLVRLFIKDIEEGKAVKVNDKKFKVE